MQRSSLRADLTRQSSLDEVLGPTKTVLSASRLQRYFKKDYKGYAHIEMKGTCGMIRRTHHRSSLILLSAMLLQTTACGDKKQSGAAKPATTDEAGAPKISAVDPDFDFGKVKQGAEVSHVYKIKNIGSKELVIEKTHGS